MTSGQRKTAESIEAAAEAWLQQATPGDGRWSHEAINWGDLHVVDVQFVASLRDEDHWLVEVEEASPSCQELPKMLASHLERCGFGPAIWVRTEW